MNPSSIGALNRLSESEKRDRYVRLVPAELLDRFRLSPFLVDEEGHDLLQLRCEPGSSSVEIELRHRYDFPDPIMYGHLTDTLNAQVHILLLVINNPDSPRFDVDRLPDGTPTKFGTRRRNLPAEISALAAGLSPGQVRAGLRLLDEVIGTFEQFVVDLGHDMYYIEPLYYHNAVIFERHGFVYQSGRRRMQRIHEGFSEKGELNRRLDGSTPFRRPEASESVRLRSWAIHDGILGEALDNITMYKLVHRKGSVHTTPGIRW